MNVMTIQWVALGMCAVGACNVGFDDCDGMAVNVCETPVSMDPSNCGGCGVVCPSGICQSGFCYEDSFESDSAASPCGPAELLCNGVCVFAGSDPYNCGFCGNVCASGVCDGGGCVEISVD